jgi:hypothetical protein
MNMYEQRNYTIFNTEELDKIDFNQVLETSKDTVRKSVDGSKTFVKWEGDIPSSVQSLTTRSDYYTHSQMLEILNSEEWTSPLENI